MATERQIAANRANAKKSTGPKTAAGKIRSSHNAFRHGLSGPMPEDPVMSAKIEAIARAVADGADGEHQHAFAQSQSKLQRIQEVRAGLLADLKDLSVMPPDLAHPSLSNLDVRALRRLLALDRYERVARTNRRRASIGPEHRNNSAKTNPIWNIREVGAWKMGPAKMDNGVIFRLKTCLSFALEVRHICGGMLRRHRLDKAPIRYD